MPSKATNNMTLDPCNIAGRSSPPIWFGPHGNPLDIHGLLNGCPVFLIAGGPSFSNIDHSPLDQPGCLTMGINNSPKTFRPDFWISVDDPSHFLPSIWLDPKIMKFARTEHRNAALLDNEARIQSDTTTEQCPNVVFYKSNLEYQTANFLNNDSVSWGNNDMGGGGRSVMLAALKTLYHLGAGHVFLLGVDFEISEKYTYHFPQERSKSSIEGNLKTYKILSDRFAQLQPLFQKANFHIWNCNKNSILKAFPFLSFNEAVKIATSKMPRCIKEESSTDLYNRVPGRNDSGTGFISTKSKETMEKIRRIDRHKCPKIIKVGDIQASNKSTPLSKGVLLLADSELEWLIPWWFRCFEKTNPNLPVSVSDFGLSEKTIQWLQDKNIPIIPKTNNFPKLRITCFYKPFAITASPYEITIFSNLDCEIRKNISDMFSWAEHGLVLGNDLYPMGNNRKLFREHQYYNSGLICLLQNNPTIAQWCSKSKELHELLRSDQEILNLVIYESEATVVELPPHFHQLRVDGDHEKAVVMHWTGSPGKIHIRKQMDRFQMHPL